MLVANNDDTVGHCKRENERGVAAAARWGAAWHTHRRLRSHQRGTCAYEHRVERLRFALQERKHGIGGKHRALGPRLREDSQLAVFFIENVGSTTSAGFVVTSAFLDLALL